MDTNVGYDRYGRGSFAIRATYSITPAWSVYGVVSPNWTAQKVDTDTGCPALTVATSATGCTSRVAVAGAQSFVQGDSSYLGTEINGGFTWRFAPNAAFDLAGYYLFAGSAMDMTENLNGVAVKRDARDGYYAAARVRLSFSRSSISQPRRGMGGWSRPCPVRHTKSPRLDTSLAGC